MTADPAAASPFDPTRQNHPPDLDLKIVAGLERLSEVFRTMLWHEAKQVGLSPLQIQVLIFLRFHDAALSKISHLAREFDLTKATVSDAVRVLEHKQLVSKHPEPADTRSYSVQLTPAGQQLADRTAAFATPLRQAVGQLPAGPRQDLYFSLLALIQAMQQAGTITVQRMCFSCRHYALDAAGGHFCHLLNLPLDGPLLRLDCPEHAARPT